MKTLFGLLLIVTMGWCLFAALIGLGMVMGFILTYFPWWGIVLGTGFNTIIVVSYLWNKV